MQSKQSFRRRVRELKAEVSPEALRAKSEAILRRVEALPEFRQATTVAAYWSLPDEVTTHEFLARWSGVKQIALPVMCGENELELREYHPNNPMNPAAFGIREPQDGALIQPEQVDLWLVPGMAFDRADHRLGRGKGFYDRLLTRAHGLKIGLCFDFQLFDRLPTEPHDVAMDRVIFG
jgi:5-formyltetrahydrofolate cyclo-ligase